MPRNQLPNNLLDGRFSVQDMERKTSRSTKNSPPDFWIVLCFKEKTDKDEKTMQWIRPEELSEIRESAKRWKLEREQRDREAYRQMSIEYGVKIECYGDILAEIDRQDEKSRTCMLCGFIASTTSRIFSHRDSEHCRKRIAEQKGIPYVPHSKLPKFCKACNTPRTGHDTRRPSSTSKTSPGKKTCSIAQFVTRTSPTSRDPSDPTRDI